MSLKPVVTINNALREVLISKEIETGKTRAEAEAEVERVLKAQKIEVKNG